MKRPEKNWLEWTVFSIGTVLVLGTLGFFAYSAAHSGDSPPKLEIHLGKVEPQGSVFVVPVSVRNFGDKAAEEVNVEVTFVPSSGEKEDAQFQVAFLPRRSERSGWVTFTQDPSQGQLKARAIGYGSL